MRVRVSEPCRRSMALRGAVLWLCRVPRPPETPSSSSGFDFRIEGDDITRRATDYREKRRERGRTLQLACAITTMDERLGSGYRPGERGYDDGRGYR